MNSQKQASYRARKRAQGLHRVEVWVPAEAVEKVRAYAKKLSDKLGTPTTD